MITITVELRSAITGKVTTLAKMDIHNDGSGTENIGNYGGRILRKPKFNTITREGYVQNHPRKTKTVWHLICKMLNNMEYNK